MKTYVEIEGLRIYAYHGVLDQERKVGNYFEITLRVEYPFSGALLSDNLEDTISYADLCAIIQRQMAIPSKLLEHVAGRIIESIKSSFPKIESGIIKITKITPPIEAQMKGASIIVEW